MFSFHNFFLPALVGCCCHVFASSIVLSSDIFLLFRIQNSVGFGVDDLAFAFQSVVHLGCPLVLITSDILSFEGRSFLRLSRRGFVSFIDPVIFVVNCACIGISVKTIEMAWNDEFGKPFGRVTVGGSMTAFEVTQF